MHICHIILNNIGGAPKVADSLITSQSNAGCKVSAVVLTVLDLQWMVSFKAAKNVIVMKVAGTQLFIGGIIQQIWIAIQLSKVIAEQKPDIVICHTAFITKLFYISQFISGKFSVPYISYIHSDYISESLSKSKINSIKARIQNQYITIDNWINLNALKQASGIVLVCKALYEKFSSIGLNHDRMVISYNPAINDTSNEILHPIADSWLNNSDLVTFVCAARFHKQKDHKTLLKAFAKVSKTHTNIRLILLGDGELETEIQALANFLAINNIVLFAGSVNNPRAYFSLSRAVVLSSHFEGFGLVVVEAVASGVTFIASDCPVGPGEISELLECGTLFPPGDVDALAEAMMNCVKTPKEIIDRSQQIERIFSESSCANRLESLIFDILHHTQ
ncbi:glycosyltransferase [Fortiea sp. LEGE XX443]|uniref:glycosyltransferase n=1 Tax=Fortiea sp. LEGE XX443 TaxID=1828611 RepID=UPI00188132C1|nr:glycosyltransferase [Fortiea sp. LEGE XX443]MBE9005527.1 glycosyltransferase [Fortiea sp. LEGE XX443]